jgi:hypothetical protein
LGLVIEDDVLARVGTEMVLPPSWPPPHAATTTSKMLTFNPPAKLVRFFIVIEMYRQFGRGCADAAPDNNYRSSIRVKNSYSYFTTPATLRFAINQKVQLAALKYREIPISISINRMHRQNIEKQAYSCVT